MKHGNIRKIILIAAVVVILTAGTVVFAYSGVFNFFELGKQDKEMQVKADSVLVVVNGKYEITNNQVERALLWSSAFYEANVKDVMNNPDLSEEDKKAYLASSKAPTRDELLQNMIKNKVLLSEAEKRGISVADEQAEKFIMDNYKAGEEILKNGDEASKASAQKALTMLDEILKGMGTTREEYMREYQIPGMKDVMTRQALRNSFVASLPQEKQIDRKAAEAAFDEFVSQLIQSADIQWNK